jgi:2'-5' RNA ligase
MRLFIASTFPEGILWALNERLGALKPKLPSASWVRPETQHLTYAFLGEQDESLIEALAPRVAAGLATIARFDGALHGCGFFPNARHARVGWVGVAPEERLRAVATAVRESVTACGIELDHSEFKPHLTLMRIRDRWPPLAVETFEKSLRDYRSAPFPLDGVTLYSSRLNPKGAIHTPVREFALA